MRLAPLLLAPLLALGCAYTVHEGPTANGEDHVLYFTDGADLWLPLPVGVARTFRVEHLPGGDQTCHPAGIKNAPATPLGQPSLATQGGDLGLHDTCDGVARDPIAFESATCDGDACRVTTEPDGDGLLLHVIAQAAATTHLRVVVHGTKDGAVYSDSLAVTFAPAARIRLSGHAIDLLPIGAPMLLGMTVDLPRAEVVDEAGSTMSLDDGAIVRTIDGSAWQKGDYEDLVAVAPGHALVRWEVPGVLSRTIDLEAVDPAEARAIEIVDSAVDGASVDDHVDLDGMPAFGASDGPPLAGIKATAAAPLAPTYDTRIVLADGRRALAKLDASDVAPDVLATASPDDFHPWELSVWTTFAEGAGTLTIRAGSLSRSLPIEVVAPSK